VGRSIPPWFWKAVIAGFCGSVAHWILMYAKFRLALVPTFQPYNSFQVAISQVVGNDVHPIIPWLLSLLNGSTILGLVFGRFYQHIPGRNGAIKGAIFGAFGWIAMGMIFFPWLGLGLFATGVGLGLSPAAFSLAMVLAYSVVLGVVYAALSS
jgi:hypothetical protein